MTRAGPARRLGVSRVRLEFLYLRSTRAVDSIEPVAAPERSSLDHLPHALLPGTMEINGAPVTLEDCASLAPGESGTVRLHPLWRDGWMHLRPGAQIDMHEGSRVVGTAIVMRVTLSGGPPLR
jgi:hypothetical protein